MAGSTTAVLSWTAPRADEATDLRLRVTRAGVAGLDRTVHLTGCEQPYCRPTYDFDRDPLRVLDLDGDGEPEVLVDVFTGGAHCCVETLVARFDGTAYVTFDVSWGDAGYRLGDIGGPTAAPEFVSADTRFGYRFTAFAFSLFPVRIVALRAGRLRDVTAEFPRRIAADAASALRIYRNFGRTSDDTSRGAFAAYAADAYRLGRRPAVLRLARHEARAHRLGTVRGGLRFVSDLDGFLTRLGYRPR